MHLMRVPLITNIWPNKIFNMASIHQIEVTGRDYLSSKDLVCIFRGDIIVQAVFVSDSKLLC